MNIQETKTTKHKELLSLLNPLVDFMIENGFTYFLVAGKDGMCTRHLRGDYDDVEGMIKGFMENNKQIAVLLQETVESFNKKQNK